MLADNENGIEDHEGDKEDWLELFNASMDTLDLTGFTLSDDVDIPGKWSFGSVVLIPGDFLLLFASGKDTVFAGAVEELHTNFKISKSGESLYLSDTGGEIIDSTPGHQLFADQSIVRITDGGSHWFFTSRPSPSAANVQEATIYASHESGFYEDSFLLDLVPSSILDTIYYTLDGSLPTPASARYMMPTYIRDRSNQVNVYSNIRTTPSWGPLYLDEFIFEAPDAPVFKSTVINYRSYSNGVALSPVYSKSFFVHPNMNEKYTMPITSMVTDGNNLFDYYTGIYVPGERFQNNPWVGYWPVGNYSNDGQDWEKPVHVKYFEADGTFGFQTNAGIRMHGGSGGLAMPQKSLRLYFRSEYGLKELKYDLFDNGEVDEFKRLIFRNSGQDFNHSHFRDVVLQNVLKDLDVELQNYQPSIVMLNGEYWGIHNIRERYDHHFFKNHFGIEEEDLIIVGVCGEEDHGSAASYNSLVDFINNNDLSLLTNYNTVAERIDIPNFIHYMITNIYYANHDWPCNNFKMWRTTATDSKWRWLIYDLDVTFNYSDLTTPDFNSIEFLTSVGQQGWPNCDCSTLLFRKLLENNIFEALFLQSFTDLMNTIFRPSSIINQIDQLRWEYEVEMEEHIQRWNYPSSTDAWLEFIQEMKQFAWLRPCEMERQLREYFGSASFDFDCSTVVSSRDETLRMIKVFPNPVAQELTIMNLQQDDMKVEIMISDMTGKVIYTDTGGNKNLTTNQVIDLSGASPGVYMLTLKHKDGMESQKIIIAR